MNKLNLFAISFFMTCLTACATYDKKVEAKPKSPSTLESSTSDKVSPSKELAFAKDSVKDSIKSFGPEIVGVPLAGGKFAKLKIGMAVKEVEALIGLPDRQWRQPTGAEATPYYNGTDRLLIQHAYKSEGILTFNQSPEHSLIRILVNRAELM